MAVSLPGKPRGKGDLGFGTAVPKDTIPNAIFSVLKSQKIKALNDQKAENIILETIT